MEALPRSICLWNSSRNTKMSVVRALFHTPRLWNTVKCDEMYAQAALVSLQGRLRILSPSRASQLPQTAMGPCAPAEGRVRRPPITPPQWSTGFLPCCSLTPFPCHHAVYRSPSVDSG